MLFLAGCATDPADPADITPLIGSPADADGVLLGSYPQAGAGWQILVPPGDTEELFVRTDAGLNLIPTPTASDTIGHAATATVSGRLVGDQDGDGATDVFAFDPRALDDCEFEVSGSVWTGPLVGSPSPTLTFSVHPAEGCGDWPYARVLGDPDEDGTNGLVAVYGYAAWTLPRDGAGTVEPEPWLELRYDQQPERAGDVDGDGVDDLLLLLGSSTELQYGPIPAGEPAADVTMPQMSQVLAGDLDGDGHADLLTSNCVGVYLFHPATAGTLADLAFATLPSECETQASTTAIGASHIALARDGTVWELAGPFSGTLSLEEGRRWTSEDDSFGDALAFGPDDRLYVGAPAWTETWSAQGAVFWFDP